MAHLTWAVYNIIDKLCLSQINDCFLHFPEELIFNQSGSSLWHQEDPGSNSISTSHQISEPHLLIKHLSNRAVIRIK